MKYDKTKKVNLFYGVDVLKGLRLLPDNSVHCCVTSPPYFGLRDYGVKGQVGFEKTPNKFVERMVGITSEIMRVLRPDGTFWLNLGDSYSSHKDCKMISQTLAKGTSRVNAHRIENGMSHSRNTKSLKSVGLKNKDLIGVPWMVAFALRANGWYLRQEIIWSKPNPMPESVTDRCTKSHEHIFLLTKSAKYYFDSEAIKETATGYDGRRDTVLKGSPKYVNGLVPDQSRQTMAVKNTDRWKKRKHAGTKNGGNGTGFQDHSGYNKLENPYVRNKRSVWEIATHPYKGAHFATFPPELIQPMIMAGCPADGIVLDPFSGSGTTGAVATGCGRDYIGIDLNKKYLEMARQRIGLFACV